MKREMKWHTYVIPRMQRTSWVTDIRWIAPVCSLQACNDGWAWHCRPGVAIVPISTWLCVSSAPAVQHSRETNARRSTCTGDWWQQQQHQCDTAQRSAPWTLVTFNNYVLVSVTWWALRCWDCFSVCRFVCPSVCLWRALSCDCE